MLNNQMLFKASNKRGSAAPVSGTANSGTPTARIAVPALKDSAGWYQFCFGTAAYQAKLSREPVATPEEEPEEPEGEGEGEGCGPVDKEEEVEDEEEDEVLQLLRAKKAQLLSRPIVPGEGEQQVAVGMDIDPGTPAPSPEDRGEAVPSSSYARYDPQLHPSHYYPSVALLVQLDHVMNQRVLGYLMDWWVEEFPVQGQGQGFSAGDVVDPCSGGGGPSWLHGLTHPVSAGSTEAALGELHGYLYYRCVWLYGVFVRLETPLCREMCAHIRLLGRHLLAMRFELRAYKQGQRREQDPGEQDRGDHDPGEDRVGMILAMLNMLIYISCVYFNQGLDLLRDIGDI